MSELDEFESIDDTFMPDEEELAKIGEMVSEQNKTIESILEELPEDAYEYSAYRIFADILGVNYEYLAECYFFEAKGNKEEKKEYALQKIGKAAKNLSQAETRVYEILQSIFEGNESHVLAFAYGFKGTLEHIESLEEPFDSLLEKANNGIRTEAAQKILDDEWYERTGTRYFPIKGIGGLDISMPR